MPWLLRSNTTQTASDYVSAAAPITYLATGGAGYTGDWQVRFRFKLTASQCVVATRQASEVPLDSQNIIFFSGATTLQIRRLNVTVNLTLPASASAADRVYTLTGSASLGNVTVEQDGVFVGTLTGANLFLNFRDFFKFQNTTRSGELYWFELSNNGIVTNYYINTTGTGTSWIDTVGGNNAAQVGTWPADNSEWVFYSTGATYQLTAQGGTFSYTGSSAALNRGYKLAAQGATYTYTGASASLTYNTATVYRMDALGASYSYAGASASLLRGFKLAANGGAYSYAGSDAVLRRGFKLAADGGAFNYAGADASLTYVAGPIVYRLTALGVTYVYSGGNAILTATGVIPAANPAAFVNRAYVGGRQVISAQVGGRLVNNAKIGGSLTNNATVAI